MEYFPTIDGILAQLKEKKGSIMKQILVIATGGTIACRSTTNGLVPQIAMEEFLNYVPKIHSMCELHAIQLMNLDSTNMQKKIRRKKLKDFKRTL